MTLVCFVNNPFMFGLNVMILFLLSFRVETPEVTNDLIVFLVEEEAKEEQNPPDVGDLRGTPVQGPKGEAGLPMVSNRVE